MAKTKNRVTSVLLVLCMVMVMLAGMLIAAPVQVQAARIGGVNYNFGGDRVLASYLPSTFSYVGLDSGTMTIFDDKGNSWQGTFPMSMTAANQISPGIPHSDFTPTFVYDNNADYYMVLSAGTLFESDISGATSGTPMGEITFGNRPAWLDPQPAPDAGTGEYYDRHYNFWNGVHAQLSALPNNGRVTVDTEGHSLDMVMHFTFDALNNTNRTLVIKHQGSTYTIRGKAESADHAWMGGILLGNNHSFSILGAYRK